MPVIKVLRGAQHFQHIQKEWHSLYERAASHPFNHPTWCSAVARAHKLDRHLVTLLFQDKERLFAVVPFVQKGSLVTLSSLCKGLGDPLVLPGKELFFLKGLRAFARATGKALVFDRMCEPLFSPELRYQARKRGWVTMVNIRKTKRRSSPFSFRLLRKAEWVRHQSLLVRREKPKERSKTGVLLESMDEALGAMGIFTAQARAHGAAFLMFCRRSCFIWQMYPKQLKFYAALYNWANAHGFGIVYDLQGGCSQNRQLFGALLYG